MTMQPPFRNEVRLSDRLLIPCCAGPRYFVGHFKECHKGNNAVEKRWWDSCSAQIIRSGGRAPIRGGHVCMATEQTASASAIKTSQQQEEVVQAILFDMVRP